MSYKSFKHLALAVIVLASASSLRSINQPTTAYDTATTFNPGLDYLEFYLFAAPTAEMNSDHDRAKSMVAVSALVAYFGASIKKYNISTKDILKFGLLGWAGSTVYTQLYSSRETSIIQKHFINFVNNWEKHRSRTPEQFHELFDSLSLSLSQIVKDQETLQICVQDVLGAVRFQLSHKFPSRFSNNMNTLNDTKTVSDIMKNLTEFTK